MLHSISLSRLAVFILLVASGYTFVVQSPVSIMLAYGLVFILLIEVNRVSSYFLLCVGLIVIVSAVVLFAQVIIQGRDDGFQRAIYLLFSALSLFSCAALISTRPISELDWIISRVFVFFMLNVFVFIAVSFISLGKVDFEGAIPGVSTNGIPAFLLYLAVAYVAVHFKASNRILLVPAILCLVVSFYGVGRANILVSIFFLFVCLLFRVGALKMFSLFIVVCTGIFAFAPIFEAIGTLAISHTKLSVGLADPARSSIVLDYIGRIDFISLFIGVPEEGTVASLVYAGNFHNSFIRAHSYFGLPYLAFIVVCPLFVFLYGHGKRNMMFYSCILLIFYVRGFVESNNFPSYIDFYYFFVVLIPFLGKDKVVYARKAASQSF